MKPVGGRGHTAPYQTTHVRVPVAVKPLLEAIIADYREWVIDNPGELEQSLPNHLSKLLEDNYRLGAVDVNQSSSELPDQNQAIQIAKSVLKGKQSARKSLSKMLTALYKETITL